MPAEIVDDPLLLLTELLSGRAQPEIHIKRAAPSTTYDLDYRTSVIAAAFAIHASDSPEGKKRIRTQELKLLQFVAQRPWLVSTIIQWSIARRGWKSALFSPQHLRRGYLNDRMFDDVIDFLAAQDAIKISGLHTAVGASTFMDQEYQRIVTQGLYKSERKALEELKDILITNEMLEGS